MRTSTNLLLIIIGLVALPLDESFSQKMTIDSLRGVFNSEKNPDKRLAIYHQIADEALEVDIESAHLFADTLQDMALKISNKRGVAQAISLKGQIAKNKGAFKNAIDLFKESLSLRFKIKDSTGIAKNYIDIGASYKELYQADSAIHYYLKGIEIYEKISDYSNIASTYANIGNLYSDNQAHDKAIEFLEKALKIRLEHGEEKKTMYTYNNLSTAYGKAGHIDKALEYAQKGIDVALKYGNTFVAGVIEGGMGHLFIEKKLYSDAISHCEKSIQYLEATNRKINLVFPMINMAKAYNLLNDPQKALLFAQKGYDLMLETKQKNPLEEYYEQFAAAYEKMGNYKASLEWYKKFVALDDSLFQAQNVKNLAEIETKYQTKEKEAKIAQQDLALYRQKTWLIALIISLLAFAAFAYLYYNRYRLKQKAILDAAIIKEQQLGLNAVIEAQETERKRIAKDLHDGIAQELVALKLGFNRLQNKIEKLAPDEAQNIGQLTHQLNDSCNEVRNIAHVMMPPSLETSGLVSALETLLRSSLHHTSIQTEFEHFDLPVKLNDKTEIGLYRIAQELLNNILKHAEATKVIVQLYKAGNQLIMRFEDNGKGFDFDAAKQKSSMGLLNILSRVNNLGGTFFSEKGESLGTISTVRIPILT